jgi:tripartite-type tricarboxylate transporter receptor subunit TctC
MGIPRSRFLHLAARAAAVPAVSCVAWAQTYPTRPVHIIVAFSAGGGLDIVARLTGQWLSERLGRAFVIENRPGAGGNIGTEAVVRAPTDGYTLLLVAPPNAINATLYDKLSFNFIRDIAPVASIIRQPLVMLVNPSVPAKTVPEFIAYAKANPGKINMASSGIGSANLPDLPTVGEFVPGYEWSSWYGIGAPKGTPADIVGTLNRGVASY